MTSYYKLSGAGNDFLALVEPPATPGAEEIRAWCRRGVSLGADGLFVLTRTGHGARITHFNADGGRSELCLNGSRCAARLAFELGWSQGDELELATDAGDLAARHAGERGIEVALPPIIGDPEPATLDAGGRRHAGWRLRVGVPHFVLPWPAGLDDAPVAELGPALRAHPDLGLEGANVDFVRWVSTGRCEVRTFERGVEAETLACGTSVVATVAAGLASGRLEPPVAALTSGGFELAVAGNVVSGRLRSATLTGDARILSRGKLLPAAASLPSAPEWSRQSPVETGANR